MTESSQSAESAAKVRTKVDTEGKEPKKQYKKGYSDEYGRNNAVFNWAFTWYTDLKTVEASEIVVKCLRAVAKDWNVQCQNTKEDKKDHFQGRFSLKIKNRHDTVKKNLEKYGLVGVHIEPEKNAKGSKHYCFRLDATTIAGPWSSTDWHQEVDGPMVVLPTDLFPWKRTVLDIIGTVPDGRTCNVIINPRGKVGKTLMSRLLHFQYDTAVFRSMPNIDNLLTMVTNDKWHRAYVFDYPRTYDSKSNPNDMWNLCEQVNDGFICSGKYVPKRVFRGFAHVWVFTNTLPDLKCLSQDRWKLWTISDDLKLVPFNKSKFFDEQKEDYIEKRIEQEKDKKRKMDWEIEISKRMKLEEIGDGPDSL